MAPATAALLLAQPLSRLFNSFPSEMSQLRLHLSGDIPDLASVAALMSTCGATLTPVVLRRDLTIPTKERRGQRRRVLVYIVVPYWALTEQSDSTNGNPRQPLGDISCSVSTHCYKNKQGSQTTVTLQLVRSITGGVPVSALVAPTQIPAITPISAVGGDAGERLQWSKTLAETPTDAMGDDHFRFMGQFMGYGDAVPYAFETLALAAFEQRLAHSRRYGTWFAEQVSPGWRTGNPRRCYLERWAGEYDRLIWSFGIKGHSRADQIWHMMQQRLPKHDVVTREFLQDVSDMEVALRPETVAIRSWTFRYRTIELFIFQDRNDNFFLCHAQSSDIPKVIRPRLTKLWNATLDRSRTTHKRLRSLAEFEWLWYWTNPFVRGGATTGSLLSAFLRKSLEEEGVAIRARYPFVMQDLWALTTDCPSYIRERVAQLGIQTNTSGVSTKLFLASGSTAGTR